MSEKVIRLGEKEVALRCSGATYIKYRNEFKADLFVELQKFSDTEDGVLPDGAMETLLRATYIMAKQANPGIKENLEEWLDQFELMETVGLQEAFELIVSGNTTLDEAKKNNNQQSEK